MFEDVALGNSKLFIRSPRTLTALEEERSNRLPQVVVTMQRVSLLKKMWWQSCVCIFVSVCVGECESMCVYIYIYVCMCVCMHFCI